jgi:hypothetical protein
VERLKNLPVNWRLNGVVKPMLVVLGLIGLGGVILQLVRGPRLISLCILAMIVAVCLLPWPEQGVRYWAPVLPFLALAMFQCLTMLRDSLAHILPSSIKPLAHHLLVVSVVCLILTGEALTLVFVYTKEHQEVEYVRPNGQRSVSRLFFYTKEHRALDTALEWLKSRSRPEDIVAASMPQWSYLRTGLRAVMPPFERNTHKAQQLLDSIPVEYVVVDKLGGPAEAVRDYVLPVLVRDPQRWHLVYSSLDGGASIYQRTKTENF